MSKTDWDLKLLFNSDQDPKIKKQLAEIEKRSSLFIKKWQDGSYLKSPSILKEALDEYESFFQELGYDGAVGYYFSLKASLDQINPTIKAQQNKIIEFHHKVLNSLQFFEINLSKISPNLQKLFLNSKELQAYQHFLERLFAQAKYILSEPEERILNLKSQPAYGNWVRMLSTFLSKEERKVLSENKKLSVKSLSEISSLINNKDKKIRDTAAIAFNQILEKHSDSAEAEINSVLQNKKIDDELRGIDRPDLLRHLSDDIETEVVDSLVSSVSNKYEISQNYYRLKARLLHLKKLEYHERNVEYGKVNQKYNFDKTTRLIEEVLESLDPEFREIFVGFLENGQIDVYPKKGKRDGAFCAHHLITQPTYILLNHNGELRDVLTLAHELGHGINNELIKKSQHSLYFDTPLATAEVASTFMEDFVLQKLLAEADDQTKLSLMMTKLNDDVSTIFRQIACYNFERELHQTFREKGYLSKQEIGKIFQKQMASYMGKAVLQSKGSENWWIYWSHIRTFFYNYSYASGLLISKSLQSKVKQDPKFILEVKQFLSSGLSDSPKNIFLKLGIDLGETDFWIQGLKEVEELLKETEKLAKKLGRI